MSAFSIIVPVFNAEKYLFRCINSIIAQSFNDYELILVDDGSTDKSLEICSEFAKDNPQIKVISKPHGGVSAARNSGLAAVSGEWVKFADADDEFTPDCLEITYKLIEEQQDRESVLISDFDIEVQSSLKKIIIPSIRDRQSFLSYFIGSQTTVIWNLTIPRYLIDNNQLLFDPDITIGEDLIFAVNVFCCAKKIVNLNHATYIYHKNDSSVTAHQDKIFLQKKYTTYEKLKSVLLSKRLFSKLRFTYYHKYMYSLQDMLTQNDMISPYAKILRRGIMFVCSCNSVSWKVRVLSIFACLHIYTPIKIANKLRTE